MTDAIGSIDALAGGDVQVSVQEMAEMGRQKYEEESQRTEFSGLVDRAISTAVDRPGQGNDVSNQRKEMLGGAEGPVGEAMHSLRSDVSRGPESTAAADNQEAEDTLEERVMSLYIDLTDYQVAWKIAQKIPQDLSQILKGS